MKKLNLDGLRVDSFATSDDESPARGTVLGAMNTGTGACPISYNGTCVISCRPCDRVEDAGA